MTDDKNENYEPMIHKNDILYSGFHDNNTVSTLDTSLATLCIKSRISSDHEDNDLLRQMINECYGGDETTVSTELVEYDQLEMKLFEHTVKFYDSTHFTDFLKRIYDHLVFPTGPYENIKYGDFEVAFVKGDLGCYTTYMAKKIEMMEEQMMIDKHVMNSLNNSIKKLETNVESITTFFNNMGLARYKPTMQAILQVLDEHGMVNQEHMESQIFTETH